MATPSLLYLLLLHHSAKSAVLEPVIVQVTSGVKLTAMASVTEAKGNALISWEVAPVPVTIHLSVVVMALLIPTSARQLLKVSTLITQAPVIMIGPAKSARIISAQVASGAELSVPAMTSVEAKGLALTTWEAPARLITILCVVAMAKLTVTSARQRMQVSTLLTQVPVPTPTAESAIVVRVIAQITSGVEL
jgi:hypothetical protein